jgi:hypothetical protein
MIVASLSQLSHCHYQLPTVHCPAYIVSAANLEALGRLSHATGWQQTRQGNTKNRKTKHTEKDTREEQRPA